MQRVNVERQVPATDQSMFIGFYVTLQRGVFTAK